MKKLVDIVGKEVFDELPDETKKEYGEKELIINDGTYIPKAKFDNLNETKKNLENQLKETNDKIQELSKVDNKELQTKLDELQKKYDDDIKSAKEKYETREYEYKVKDYIKDEKFSSKASQKAYYSDLLSKGLKFDEDGKLKGYDDYKKSYQENDPGAFIDESKQNQMYADTGDDHEKKEKDEEAFINSIMGIKSE